MIKMYSSEVRMSNCDYFVTPDSLDVDDTIEVIFCESFTFAQEEAERIAKNDPGVEVTIWNLKDREVVARCIMPEPELKWEF